MGTSLCGSLVPMKRRQVGHLNIYEYYYMTDTGSNNTQETFRAAVSSVTVSIEAVIQQNINVSS